MNLFVLIEIRENFIWIFRSLSWHRKTFKRERTSRTWSVSLWNISFFFLYFARLRRLLWLPIKNESKSCHRTTYELLFVASNLLSADNNNKKNCRILAMSSLVRCVNFYERSVALTCTGVITYSSINTHDPFPLTSAQWSRHSSSTSTKFNWINIFRYHFCWSTVKHEKLMTRCHRKDSKTFCFLFIVFNSIFDSSFVSHVKIFRFRWMFIRIRLLIE